MALVRFNDGRKDISVSAEEGAAIWEILNGEKEGDEKQQRFCERIEKLTLNWKNAPDSYIKARFHILVPMIMRKWMAKGWKSESGQLMSSGEITLPEPRDEDSWAFGEKWGLLKDGQLTTLGRRYANGERPKVHPW